MTGSRLVIVTGMSGAGRMSCLKILEDLGFDAVDNLPVSLLERLAAPINSDKQSRLAVGMDSRSQGFSPQAVMEALQAVRGADKEAVELLFIDCDDEILRRRYTETRRRHPMAPDRPLMESITRERALLSPVKVLADAIIDTTDLSIVGLRRLLASRFETARIHSLAITVTSFAYRNGLPRDADLVFDVRFLNNPHYDPALKNLTGLNEAVSTYVFNDPGFHSFFDSLLELVLPLLPRFESEGKSYLTVAIGCTGGQHRSVAIAERLNEMIRNEGWEAMVVHRERAQWKVLPEHERSADSDSENEIDLSELAVKADSSRGEGA